MRNIPLILSFCLLLPCVVSGQNQVRLSGQISACDRDTLLFFELDGVSLRALAAIPLQATGNGGYSLDVNINGVEKGFYLLGSGAPESTCLMVLGDEPLVQIQGGCRNFYQATVSSPENQAWTQVQKVAQQIGAEQSRLIGLYRNALNAKGDTGPLAAQMRQLDQSRLGLLDSLRKSYPFLAKAQALNTLLSFQGGMSQHPDEISHVALSYFDQANLSDPAYNRIPALHESMKTYASTLTQLGLFPDEVIAFGQQQLNRIPGGSRAHKAALLGLVAGFRQQEEDAFAHFASAYMRGYPEDNPQIYSQLKAEVAAVASRLIGAVAPEIRQPTPAGDSLSLSSLRGKYVLIDFWASWCGPCRKENPNVVRMYNTYKDKGFEIIGVSLDRTKDAWVKAIAADGLTWKHVSDLKYWDSAVSRAYAVHSIPYTVLLDPQGRIIAKRLRGARLEQKLGELFREQGTGNKEQGSGNKP